MQPDPQNLRFLYTGFYCITIPIFFVAKRCRRKASHFRKVSARLQTCRCFKNRVSTRKGKHLPMFYALLNVIREGSKGCEALGFIYKILSTKVQSYCVRMTFLASRRLTHVDQMPLSLCKSKWSFTSVCGPL